MKNTVIFKFTNMEHNHGFGDLVRGLITIKQIQKVLGFDLIVDTREFFIHKYLINTFPVIDHTHYIIMRYGDANDHHEELTNVIRGNFELGHKFLSITTPAQPRINEIDDEIRDFMKKVFTFTPEFEEYFKEKCKGIPSDYNLYHYRLGDHLMNLKNEFKNSHFYVSHFQRYKKENSVLISDSVDFKKMIRGSNSNVFTIENNPIHSNSNIAIKNEINEQNYMDLLVDFFLIKNAKTIQCYSCYSWISNFVYWTSVIYDVPLTNLPSWYMIEL